MSTTSSDGVLTATVLSQYAAVELVVDFTVAGSPISTTAASTVYRITVTEQGSGNIVRSLAAASAPGGACVGIDHESSFGASLSYVAQALDASGNVLATSAACSASIPAPSGGIATWLKSLTTPSMSLVVKTSTIPDWSAPIAQGVIAVMGRPDPIVVQDVREYESGTLEVLTQTPQDEAALRALLATAGPYLLQQPGFGVTDRYVTVGTVGRKRPIGKAWEQKRTFQLPLTQVIRPNPAGWSVAIPGKTYADSTANLPLYSNRTGTYLSRSQ